ncbi:hypothetical protein ES703_69818 [subsurface metagenome]
MDGQMLGDPINGSTQVEEFSKFGLLVNGTLL